MLSKIPVGGVIWQTAHYLAGLERLGCEVYYVEAHARTPAMFAQGPGDDGSARAAEFIAGVMRRFGLGDRWAFHALHAGGRCYGLGEGRLRRLYREAALLVNLHGGTLPLEEHTQTGRLVYLETDPVAMQVELHERRQNTLDFLAAHSACFTFAENYGRPGCGLPVAPGFTFHPTRQPVVLDFWQTAFGPDHAAFTTVGSWRQWSREVRYAGEVYQWSKHFEFQKFLDLPARTGQAFELALSRCGEADQRRLESKGWRVRAALDFSTDPEAYRDYIRSSRAEFTVAKDQNVRLRTGWFSDRSATYLAAGRPVVTQDTGFGETLPLGTGLFAFSTLEEAAGAVEAINANYPRASEAARAIAREFFSHEVVLRPLLELAGLRLPGHAAAPKRQSTNGPPAALASGSQWQRESPVATL
jgi:hypothetical protein